MNEDRNKIFELLQTIFKIYPNLRFGQVISYLNSSHIGGVRHMDIFYSEDKEIIEYLKDYIKGGKQGGCDK
jgi:hypothetical protein